MIRAILKAILGGVVNGLMISALIAFAGILIFVLAVKLGVLNL